MGRTEPRYGLTTALCKSASPGCAVERPAFVPGGHGLLPASGRWRAPIAATQHLQLLGVNPRGAPI